VISPSASAAPLLEAKALTREFDEGHVKALRGVDFSIKEGEFVAITGPSGCGKSTLLQLLGALDRPTSGTLFYRGISLPDHPNPAAYRAREVGFIFQAFHLLPTFTAAENVQIPMFEIDRSASSPMGQRYSLRMNRPVILIAKMLNRSSTSLFTCNRSRVAPWCSSLMIQRLPGEQEGSFG